MAGGKLSARQKMINMMYLVLTALLALNVTKEILLAFTVLDNSLQKSTGNIEVKTEKIVQGLKKTAEDNNLGAKSALKFCVDANNETKALIDYIHRIKTELLRYSQGSIDPNQGDPKLAFKIDPEKKSDYIETNQYPWIVKKNGEMPELVSGDNLDDHVRYFNEELNGKRGKDLEVKINETRVNLLNMMKKAQSDPNLAKNKETVEFLNNRMKDIALKTTLSAGEVKDPFNKTSGLIEDHEGKKLSWSEVYMHSTPLAAVFAMMSKIENDAKILEAEVCQGLAESVSAADFKFDAIIPVISAKTGAVVTGQTYEADILLAAYNSKANMMINVNGASVPVENGVGKYKVTPQRAGANNLDVKISVPKPGGGFEVKTATAEFTAFAPQASIEAIKLNVMYVSLDNPISITVAGIDPKNVVPRLVGCKINYVTQAAENVGMATNAVLRGSNGNYTVTIPSKVSDVQIQVSAKLPDGRMKPMGTKNFRVKGIPDPTFKCGQVDFKSGTVELVKLKEAPAAQAALEGFVYEGVKYQIQSFKFTGISNQRGYLPPVVVQGSRLDKIGPTLNQLRKGDDVKFTDIIAVGPGNKTVLLSSVVATLK
jgi:gliding motility-associated protein GldM